MGFKMTKIAQAVRKTELRILKLTECRCKDGYYSDNLYICQLCNDIFYKF